MRALQIIVTFLGLGLLGFFWADIFESGPELKLTAPEREVARRAANQARSACLDNPIARLLTTALIVREVKLSAHVDDQNADLKDALKRSITPPGAAITPGTDIATPAYEVFLQSYSVFGLYEGNVYVRSDGYVDCLAALAPPRQNTSSTSKDALSEKPSA